MLEVLEKVKCPLKELGGITTDGSNLYIVSNERNKVLKYGNNREILESFNALGYAEYLECLSLACNGSNLYFALRNGEVWKKSLVDMSENMLMKIEGVAGIHVKDGNLFVFSQNTGKISTYSLTDLSLLFENRLSISGQGLTYDNTTNYFLTVDSVTGDLIYISFVGNKFSVVDRKSGIEPFAMEYFIGDLTFKDGYLRSCQGEYMYQYQLRPYKLYVKEAGSFVEKSIIEILKVAIGSQRILELKIENIGTEVFPNVRIGFISSPGSLLASSLTLSVDNFTYENEITLPGLVIGSSALFYIQANVPPYTPEMEEMFILDVKYK